MSDDASDVYTAELMEVPHVSARMRRRNARQRKRGQRSDTSTQPSDGSSDPDTAPAPASTPTPTSMPDTNTDSDPNSGSDSDTSSDTYTDASANDVGGDKPKTVETETTAQPEPAPADTQPPPTAASGLDVFPKPPPENDTAEPTHVIRLDCGFVIAFSVVLIALGIVIAVFLSPREIHTTTVAHAPESWPGPFACNPVTKDDAVLISTVYALAPESVGQGPWWGWLYAANGVPPCVAVCGRDDAGARACGLDASGRFMCMSVKVDADAGSRERGVYSTALGGSLGDECKALLVSVARPSASGQSSH